MKIDPRATCHTKDSITCNAFSLFEKSGFAKVTIAEICKSAHITRTAFYYYFNCKEDLLDYYFVYSVAAEEAKLHSYGNSEQKNIDIFFTLLYKYIDRIIQAGPELTALFMDRHISRDAPLLVSSSMPLGSLMLDSLRAAAQAGEIHMSFPESEMLHCFFSALVGQLFFWCSNDNAQDLHQSIRTCFNIVFHPVA